MKCCLCHHEKELRRSHILPSFFRDDSGSLYPTGKSGKPQPFTQPIHTHSGKRFQRKQHGYREIRHGMVEYLLCGDCEMKFSALEDYAKRYFYGNDQHKERLRLMLLTGEPGREDEYFCAITRLVVPPILQNRQHNFAEDTPQMSRLP